MDYKLLKDLTVATLFNKIKIIPANSTLNECKERDYTSFSVIVDGCVEWIPEGIVKNNPEWFEPIYEFKVGDWVYIITGGNGALGCDGKIGQIVINEYDDFIIHGCICDVFVKLPSGEVWGLSRTHKIRKATQSEIDSVTKKFPFDYKVNAETYTARECREVQADKVAISQGEGYKCLVFLTETAWKKIGELKGWVL